MNCPACGSESSRTFYSLARVPTSSNVVFRSREQAMNAPTGSLELRFCETCGFIWNAAFDPTTQHHGEYEATQGCSPTFNQFARNLAARWIEKHHLRGKALLEIGCLNGEFITQLCAMANTTGVGIDPELNLARVPAEAIGPRRFHRRFLRPSVRTPACRLHLLPPHARARALPSADSSPTFAPPSTIGPQRPSASKCPAPNARSTSVRFGDIYYEHCSYFTAETLADLFRRNRFEVLDQRTEFDGQYLTIDTRPTTDGGRLSHQPPRTTNGGWGQPPCQVAALSERVDQFAKTRVSQDRPMNFRECDRKPRTAKSPFGAPAPKPLAFSARFGLGVDAVAEVVDINPAKHGTFLAMTGQAGRARADRLVASKPTLVIGMNPAYRNEIAASRRGTCHPRRD